MFRRYLAIQRLSLAFISGCMLASVANAQKLTDLPPGARFAAQPSNGFLYGRGSVSNSYTQYSCDGSRDRLVCKFTQMMLTPQLKEKDYSTELAKKREQAEKEAIEKGGLDVLHEDLCKDFLPHLDKVEALISGNIEGLPASARDQYHSMSRAERQANKEQFSTLIEVCRSKPADWLEKIFRNELDKSMKTCTLLANNYEVIFKETSPEVYTSRRGPEGACGVVSVNVFTPDANAGYLYNYREQRVVTNRSASVPIGVGEMKCSNIDESSIEYSWRPSNEFRNCVFIKLGL